MKPYKPTEIESKWQQIWDRTGLYNVTEDSKDPKYYLLVEFPYPSGDGLHVGHVRSYTALDIMARHKRMQGYNVLYPMGFDAFGLPTENYAIKNKIAPQVATEKNVANFTRQLKSIGLSFDWNRSINTTDPEYYRWTQWIFLKLFEKGLAYQSRIPINWCPVCKTGLANEEVINGQHERCGNTVEKKLLNQWLLKITAYADRLIDDLEEVDYSDRIASQQVNWIGRSEGAEIDFEVGKDKITVFTTRPDTLGGASFLVLAPEHKLLNSITTKEQQEAVEKYVLQTQSESEIQRQEQGRPKTGVWTGSYTVNPITKEKMPIWVADYVLGGYGTGAIMAVPAHDGRDFDFAKAFELPIKKVIQNDRAEHGDVYTGSGTLIDSGEFSGMGSKEAATKIIDWLVNENLGRKSINYKMRDWVFSRQHYWGEPIPIIHCKEDGAVAVPEDQLPLVLPDVEFYEPTDTGESPLSSIEDWVNTTCPKCGGPAKRETDTMPNWAGSSWYFLRYTDATNSKEFAAKANLDYWMQVDLYNGGMEHTTLHLLYSRFWYKFLFDIGLVPTSEPYARRRSHGMILGPDGRKMSKSLGNVINPDHVIDRYGADATRMYEMFMGPFEDQTSWSDERLNGISRFLHKVWTLAGDLLVNSKQASLDGGASGELDVLVDRLSHKTIKKITQDIENMSFNTMVSTLMEYVNGLSQAEVRAALQLPEHADLAQRTLKTLILLMAPITPHMSEELWSMTGATNSTQAALWPKYDPELIKESLANIIIQVNGKFRATIVMPVDAREQDIIDTAKNNEHVKKYLDTGEIVKTIVVPQKLINFVIKS